MAERDGIVCIKWILFSGSLFMWITGTFILVFAMWLFFDTGNASAPEKLGEHLRFLDSDLGYYYAVVYLLIAAGLIILLIGLIGVLGAYRESPNMLMAYAVIISIIFICHVTAAGLGYTYRFEIQMGVARGIQNAVRKEYGDEKYYRDMQIIDYIQRRFNCCGGIGYEDWMDSNWKQQSKYQLDEVVPVSCCFGSGAVDTICPTYSAIIGGKNPYLHQTGCGTKLKRHFSDYIVGITAGGLSFGAFELITIFFAVLIVVKLRNEEKKIY